MMLQFYISSKPLSTGSHVLHRIGCPVLEIKEPGIFLGDFNNADKAVRESLKYFRKVDICPFCLKKNHEKKGPVEKVTEPDYHESYVRLSSPAQLWASVMLCGVN